MRLTEIVMLRSLRWCNDLGRREISWPNFHGFPRAHRGVELSTLCRVIEAVNGQGRDLVRVVFAEEKVKPGSVMASRDITESNICFELL